MLLYSYPDSYKHYYYVEISKEQGRNKDINSVLNLSFYKKTRTYALKTQKITKYFVILK